MGFEKPSKSGMDPHDEAVLDELLKSAKSGKKTEEVRISPPEMGDQLEKIIAEEKEEMEKNTPRNTSKEDEKPKELLN